LGEHLRGHLPRHLGVGELEVLYQAGDPAIHKTLASDTVDCSDYSRIIMSLAAYTSKHQAGRNDLLYFEEE
jgi:hypothetical protein